MPSSNWAWAAILTRLVSGSNQSIFFVVCGRKQRIGIEFAALVHVNIFVSASRRMFSEDGMEPIKRSSLVDAGGAEHESGEVVQDEDPTDFAVEAEEISSTSSIGRTYTSKIEIDRETLKGNSGLASGAGASRGLGLFGLNARWT
jgi:hypothetical protein